MWQATHNNSLFYILYLIFYILYSSYRYISIFQTFVPIAGPEGRDQPHSLRELSDREADGDDEKRRGDNKFWKEKRRQKDIC